MNRTDVATDLFQSRHLTVQARPSHSVQDSARAMFGELAARLHADAIAPIQEKVYGPAAQKDTVLRIRREVFARERLDPDLPCTYTTGRQDDDLGLAGVQVWGVTAPEGAPVQVMTVH